MRLIDISVPLNSATHVYPGDPGFSAEPVTAIGDGSPYALTRLTLGSHTGTHLDPPRHFFPEGPGVDAIPLEVLVGPAIVVEIAEGNAVTAGAIAAAGLPEGAQRVLFKTRNGELWDRPRFQRRFVHLDEDAAHALVARGVRLVGIDYLSAEQYGARQPVTHRVLLGAGVVILEGIDLRGVAPGAYTLVCLPLKVTGGDGAPARAILMTEDTLP